MLIHLGVVAAAYLSVRVYEKLTSKTVIHELELVALPEAQDTLDPSQSDEQSVAQKAQIESLSLNLPTIQKRKTQAALVSTGFFVFRDSFYFAAPLGLVFYPFSWAGPVGLVFYLYSVPSYIKGVEKSFYQGRTDYSSLLLLTADLFLLGVGKSAIAAFGLTLMQWKKHKEVKDQYRQLYLAEMPSHVWVLVNGSQIEVSLDEVKEGDHVVVSSGNVIPFDGTIVEGSTILASFVKDEQGQIRRIHSQQKQEGDPVSKGSLNLNKQILICLKPVESTREIEVEVKNVESAEETELEGTGETEVKSAEEVTQVLDQKTAEKAAAQVALFDGKNDYIELPGSLPEINEQITVEFWAKGGVDLPLNSTVFGAHDAKKHRVLNIHIPWGDGSVYWDAGNNGASFDRIQKAADPKEYKDTWIHWAFTKNINTGEMSIYHNGKLWHQGEQKQRALDGKKVKTFTFGAYGDGQGAHKWSGALSEFRIWNRALSSEEIQNGMKTRATGKTAEDGLVAYWPFNEAFTKKDQTNVNQVQFVEDADLPI
jgi:ribosomal protein S4